MNEFANLAPVFTTFTLGGTFVEVQVHHVAGTGDGEIARAALRMITWLLESEEDTTGRAFKATRESVVFEPGLIRNVTTYRYAISER